MTGSHDADAVAVWVLGACPPDEAERVEAHLAGCPSCAAEASRLRQAASSLGAAGATMPPPALRDSVLSAAHARRRPSAPAVSELARPYAGQVAALDALLSE